MNFIDLFAGAGGLSEGFIRAGFDPVAHVEMDAAACYTLRTRTAFHYLKNNGLMGVYNSYLNGTIDRNNLYNHIPKRLLDSVIHSAISEDKNQEIFTKIDAALQGQEVDLIIGGPPCQAYSLVGRARSENNMQSDPRNFLYVQYGKYLERYNPKMFVFENVLGLRSAGGGAYLAHMQKLFAKKGYEIKISLAKAEQFGVLQKRRRLVIIGWKRGLNINLPDLENFDGGVNGIVEEIFEDLPALNSGNGIDKGGSYIENTNDYLIASQIRPENGVLTQHISRPHTEQDKEIYRIAVEKWNTTNQRLSYNDLPDRLKTHQNRSSFMDRFKVVAANLSSCHTIVAHISKDGHYYIHPDINQNRSISVREAARLQSFPDDFYFEGVKEGANRTAAFKQIGNAVPPLMAENIANCLLETITSYQLLLELFD
ncbi:DNA cytosine methyltransferase [Pedobacter sp. AW31-3R]|uniref:DNA cytosine methyltransferase n=1 Tax=Pedobacter sp. AW31-3R TaxID=3445781 RepID=UPI003FA005C8